LSRVNTFSGVTVVQYRDKTSDTGVLVETAKKLHAITQRYNVPLIINDRVDVALASGAEGVHLGQDDMGKLCVTGSYVFNSNFGV
jgi:thiamine-phosphate diphosphorylase/hydroxyethylthiazole kinase